MVHFMRAGVSWVAFFIVLVVGAACTDAVDTAGEPSTASVIETITRSGPLAPNRSELTGLDDLSWRQLEVTFNAEDHQTIVEKLDGWCDIIEGLGTDQLLLDNAPTDEDESVEFITAASSRCPNAPASKQWLDSFPEGSTELPSLGSSSPSQATEALASSVSAPEPGAAIDGDTECPAKDGSSERVTSFTGEPPRCIDETATYSAQIVTNLGTIEMDLDAERAPNIVNNFVVLARYHYYDGAPFHRIIPGFVIQGGDAVGSPLGTGDPGYSIAAELPQEGDYHIGSVAMANSGADANGSQFFVITGEQGIALPPLYSLFGEVTSGLDVVAALENIPTAAGDAPSEPAIIESVTITES